jgi:regulatory factor X 1/2/3
MPIPSSVAQAIRNFANTLESCLKRAMANCPDEMMHIKVSATSTLAQTLRRYISLNHLAQAVRPVLQNPSLIYQMLVDLNQVDFRNIQEEASWVCQCDKSMVQLLEVDFKNILYEQNSLEQWAAWLKSVVSQVLKQYDGKPNFVKAARQFLLNWSFYSSLVIRDLSLRSVASFGSFHLIRLLYDEYMFFVIEHKVALETGETPIAVIG